MEPTATRTRHYGSFKHAVEFSKNGHPPTKPAQRVSLGGNPINLPDAPSVV
jgi:hypothetical protein